MDNDLTIRQNKLGYSRVFQFGPERLAVTMRDPSGELHFSVPYEAIDVMTPASTSMKNKFIQLSVIVTVLALYLSSFINALSAIAPIAAIIVAIAFFVAQMRGLTLIRFISFPLNPAPAGINKTSLTVISANSSDMVVNEINLRWRHRLKTLYGEANLQRDPKQEEARLQWLKDRGVLSEVEFSEQMRRLQSLQTDGGERPVSALN